MPKMGRLWLRHREPVVSILLLVGVCLLSFGVFIPGLGFYWDDYASIFVLQSEGLAVFDEWFGGQGRPLGGLFSAWLWDVFGIDPLPWHLLNLVLYIASVVLFWSILRLIWPDDPLQTTLTALLFAVYPAYHLRPIIISFNLILSLTLLLLSLLFLLWAVRRGQLWAAMLAALPIPIYPLVYEQPFLYELIRPLLIGLLIYQIVGPVPWRDWGERVIKFWWPSLLAGLVFVVYRLFIYQPNETYATYNALRWPTTLDEALRFMVLSIADPMQVLLFDWVMVPWNLFVTQQIDIDVPAMLTTLALLGVVVYLTVFRHQNERVGMSFRGALIGVVMGFALMMLLLLPVHGVGRHLDVGVNSRWSLVLLPVGAILLGIILPRAFRWAEHAWLLLLFLFLVGMASQTANTQAFVADWNRQQQMGWYVKARAPQLALQTNLLLLQDESYFAWGRLLNDYEIITLLNFYYPQDEYPALVSLDQRYVQLMMANQWPQSGNWAILVSGRNNLFRNWDYNLAQAFVFEFTETCLNAPPSGSSFLSTLHNPAVVTATFWDDSPMPDVAFLSPPPLDWCFYRQQIEWALQLDLPDQAATLADQAQALGLVPPADAPEDWVPLLQTYLRAGRLSEAEEQVNRLWLGYSQDIEVICAGLSVAEQATLGLDTICSTMP